MKQDIINIIFGDSISYGLYDNQDFGWINKLRKKDTHTLQHFYFNLSIPGQNSNDILNRFELELINRYNNLDIFNIIFAIGIKDALMLNKDKHHIEIFKTNISKLIEISKKYTDNTYFLGLLDVDLEIRKQYSQENIDLIDNTLKEISKKESVKYIPMKNVISKEDLTDGLHPNSLGHQKIADYIYNNIFTNNDI